MTPHTGTTHSRLSMLAIVLAGLLLAAPAAAATGLIDLDSPFWGGNEENTKDGEAGPPRPIPSAFGPDVYFKAVQDDELFLPGDYAVICVPTDDRTGYDHFVVDRSSHRVIEMVLGDPKFSENGFIVAVCRLPWDVPWPPLPTGHAPPHGGPPALADMQDAPGPESSKKDDKAQEREQEEEEEEEEDDTRPGDAAKPKGCFPRKPSLRSSPCLQTRGS